MTDREGAFKLCIFGDDFPGKTTLVNRYLTKVFDESIKMTIGADFYAKDLEIDGKNVVLRIWDFGGQQRFKVLLPSFAKGADGGIFVFDITRYTSLKNIDDWLSIFEKNVREKEISIPIIMVGILTDGKNMRSVETEDAVELSKKFNLKGYFECDLKTGKNFENILKDLTRLMLAGIGYTTTQIKPISKFLIPKYFKINDHLSLRLENGKSNIYVGGKLFNQCKYLLLNIPKNNLSEFKKIESIDEAAIKLNKKMETNHKIIPPETEFWGHCSNLQAWSEGNYDTRMLHSNIAFPLLRELVKEGDVLARKVFKQEVAKRLESGYPSVVLYLIEEDYLNCLSHEELDVVLGSPRFLKYLLKWFSSKIPEDLTKRIMEKLNNLHCAYCGFKVEKSLVQNLLSGKGIRCMYCFTCIVKDA